MLILHVENVVELSIRNMIDTHSHEWVELNVAFGFVRGCEPVFSAGDKQCREDGGLHERFPVRCLDADIGQITNFQRFDNIGFIDVMPAFFQLFL